MTRPTAALPRGRCRACAALLALLAVLPVALLLGWQLAQRLQAEQARVDAALQASAASVAGAVGRELQSSLDGLEVLSQSELFQQGRVAALGRLLHGRPRPDWESLFLLEASGAVALDTAAPGAARQAATAVHAQVMRTGRPAVSGFTEAGPGGTVATAVPVRSGEGIAYVLGARLDPAVFQRLASASTTGLDDRVTITDAGFLVIADSSGLPRGVRLAPEDPALAGAWRQLPGFGWRVRVAQPGAPLAQARHEAMRDALLAQGGAILLGALLAYAWGARLCAKAAVEGAGGAASSESSSSEA